MKVMSLEDVMVTKLRALREHEVDYDNVLEIARSLREQIDWEDVWERVCNSPYARGFFYLAEELEILDERRAVGNPAATCSARTAAPGGSPRSYRN